jgi:hypothetical protein
MKLTIKNYEKLFGREWDIENYIEDIDERRSDYIIRIWRDGLRKIVVLERNPEPNGYYKIGRYDTTTGVSSVTEPYWIKAEDIKDVNIFMNKLKLLTDEWTPKLL